MASPIPDDRTLWERVTGKPIVDKRSPARRALDDVVHDYALPLFVGAVVGGEALVQHINTRTERMAKARAIKRYQYSSGTATALDRTLSPAQVRRHQALVGFELSYGSKAPLSATTPQLERAVRLARSPRTHVVRVANAVGIADAKSKGKLDLVRAMAPLAHKARVQRALDTIAAGGRLKASKEAGVAAARSWGSLSQIAGQTAMSLGKLSAKQALAKVGHVSHMAVHALTRHGASSVLIRGGLVAGGLYGAYKLAQALAPAKANAEPMSRDAIAAPSPRSGQATLGAPSPAEPARPSPRAAQAMPDTVGPATYERTYRTGPKAGTTEVVRNARR